MEKVGFSIYLLVLVFTLRCTTITGATNPTTTEFIRTSCKITRHPALCVHRLSTYAGSIRGSDHQLAKAAVSISLKDTKAAATFVSKLARTAGMKPREFQAVRDCISTMTNSVSSLSQSVQELGQMGRFKGQAFEWHMSNVETWVGAALTNQNMCARGLADDSIKGHVKDAITKRMVYVSQVTSNALALLNRFAVRHRKGIHKP